MKSVRSVRLMLLLCALFAATPDSLSASDPSFEYLGHIDMPRIPWDLKVYEARRHFGFSRGVFCYIPERNSFLMMGHPYGQLFAEISNPGPGGQATLLHDFVDVTQGGVARQSEKYGEIRLYSLLYDRGRVLVSAEKWYNVSNVTVETHGSFTPNLDNPRFDGWWRVAGHSGQRTGYYMTRLPDRYVHDGRWLLTGGSLTWRSSSSPGPCAILVNPDDAVPGAALRPEELLRYQIGQPFPVPIDFRNPAHRAVSAFSGCVDGWMGACNVGGVVAVGDRLVFFGKQGKGYDFYGTADDYRRLTGLSDPGTSKGYFAGPYEASIWIYSLDALQRGDRSVIRMPFPWTVAERGDHDLRNVCRHGNLIYVAEANAKWFGGQDPQPVIHVLKITGLPEEAVQTAEGHTTASP